jgi:hypothetical protein
VLWDYLKTAEDEWSREIKFLTTLN